MNSGPAGKLIVLEGPDGVGKSTLAAELVKRLRGHHIDVAGLSFPGQTVGTLGGLIYRIHHEPAEFGITGAIHPAAVQLLHVAAHIDVIESTIKPALEAGRWIVLDRYWWSTWVYGRAAGLDDDSLEGMIEVELFHWNGHTPNAVFLVSRPAVGASSRLEALYNELAAREGDRSPVEHLRNDGSVEDAVTQIALTLVTGEPD